MFCDPADWEAWSRCAGKCSLEEQEPAAASVEEPLPELTRLLRDRAKSLKESGASVTVRFHARVSIEAITGEKGANDIVDALLIAEYPEHSELEVYDVLGRQGKLKIAAFSMFLTYGLLHKFNKISLGSGSKLELVSESDLYAFGAQVTEAAAVALSVRGEVTALSHLHPGTYCLKCRAAYRCPAFNELV